jgi:hypothetical protein
MMNLQAPNGQQTGELHLNGRSFVIENGLVEVPDNLITSAVWQSGYTVHQAEAAKPAVKLDKEGSK